MMGAVVANNNNLTNLERWTKNSGIYVSPDDVYLSLRGLRTLPLRLKQSSENSLAIAKYLETKKEVKVRKTNLAILPKRNIKLI